MTPRCASLAMAAMVFILDAPPIQAGDGEGDPAQRVAEPPRAASPGARPEAAPSREKVKDILREALRLIQSIADEAAKEERQLRIPSPAAFATSRPSAPPRRGSRS